MKFDCGETRQERWERLENWHEWFAWHPVRIGSKDCRWLEKVQRKRVYSYVGIEYHYKGMEQA